MGGVTRAEEVSIRSQRRVVLLENRVERAAGRKGEALLRAAQLRSKIDGMRRERLLFDQLRAKMERGLAAAAQEAAGILAQTARTHDERVSCRANPRE